MRRWYYNIAVVLALFSLWSCGTRRNTKASRFYHAFTTRYNIYFNGKQAFDEALMSQNDAYKENYSDMLYMYPISAQPKDKPEPGGPFDRAIEKCNKAIGLHSITAKPAKRPGWRNNPKLRAFQEIEEYNPFLKNCWLLMGQAQFYNADFLQASATFSYIARHYAKNEEVVAEARLWQARCYSEMGWLYDSEDILDKMNRDGIPASVSRQYAAFYADYLIKNRNFEEAVPYLKSAIKAERNGKQRSRLRYLLGQIYSELDLDGLAYEAFGDVIKSNPRYELEFAARIRQTEVFTGDNYLAVIKRLERMAKSEKNRDYLDQVYYALGNIYLNNHDTVNAIRNYHLGIEMSSRKGMDMAICQIRLGDLYFGMRDYIKAQPCFSGALGAIRKGDKEYGRISKLSAILDELVVHVEAAHLQDSLQTLAAMPETERLAIIDSRIEQLKREERKAKEIGEKERYLAEQENRGSDLNRPGTELNPNILPSYSGSAPFYFYNPQIVAQGKAQFQRKWGMRPLEDNWRRRRKELSTFDVNGTDVPMADGQDIAESREAELSGNADDPHSREYYLRQLPLSSDEIEASNLIMIKALYNMAMIYKDKLEDYPLSIEAFETLDSRFPNHSYRLESYFQIYLMALRMKDWQLAQSYKERLMSQFPESDYAMAVADPNYEYNIRRMDAVQDSIYQKTYEHYLACDTSYVRRSFKYMTERYPLARLMPKFMFLDALSYVQSGDAEAFKLALKALLDKYPDADVSGLAGEMLKGLIRGRTMVRGDFKGIDWKQRLNIAGDGIIDEADTVRLFNAERNVPYRMLLIYPTDSVDRNQLLFTVAAYNFSSFMVKEFDLSFEQAGEMSMLLISGFVNLDEIIHYYKMIFGKDGYAPAFDRSVAILPISDDNYETLVRGKSIDEYVAFFDENFGELLPDLAMRWEARLDTLEERVESDSIMGEEAVENESVIEVEVDPAVSKEAIQIVKPRAERRDMTLDEIREIRKREAAEIEAQREAARKAFEAKRRAEEELRERKANELEELHLRQAEEERAILKAKESREKMLKKERKARVKQVKAARKAKLKAREQLRRDKERAYKLRLKEKERARKAAMREKERVARERSRAKARR